MTITISQHTEILLREHAALSGQSAEAFADRVLAEELEDYQRELDESAAVIRQSLSGSPDDDTSLDAFRAQMKIAQPFEAAISSI